MIETLILLLVNDIFIVVTVSLIYSIAVKNRTPIKVIKEIKEKHEIKKQAKKQEAEDRENLYNIDIYDGSSKGQRNIGG